MIQIPKPSEQLFFIYSESGERLGVKNRETVHREGYWHRGVQLNLCSRGQLLMQRRSTQVDIAKGLLDQTLATQLLVTDDENDLQALRRGLWDELGLNIDTLHIKHVAGPQKIIKRYPYDRTLYNREFVSLYQAEFPPQKIVPKNPKVEALFWMPVDKVKRIATEKPEKFTQTFVMWLKEVM